MGADSSLDGLLRSAVVPLEGAPRDHDALLDRIGDARFVLLGEATHGSHELYRERARITKRLLEEKGFDAVAIEGDWPDVHRVNRWVRGTSADRDADAALSSFARFPTWMWRNQEMLEFVRWLRAHNDARASGRGMNPRRKVDLYGLDLYSLHSSMNAVLTYLDRVDPAAAARARARYGCFGHAGGRTSKVCIWAHNSHLGDARATEMAREGELNVGQLVRERYGRDGFLVGFTTYEGEVSAASDWDAPVEKKTLRPALEGSYEALFHGLGLPAFTVLPDADGRLPDVLRKERLERAVGVVYRPETERRSHFFRAHLADQFDAVIHVDRTRAVEPLGENARGPGLDAPDTFPFAV